MTTDITEIAKDCRVTLVAEIARIDDFLRMAEALKQYSLGLYPGLAAAADDAAPALIPADHGSDATLIAEDVTSRDSDAVTATTVEKVDTDDCQVLNLFTDSYPDDDVEPAPATNQTSVEPDLSESDEQTSASVDDSSLISPTPIPKSRGTDRADVHVGQKLRQRRWMMGMTKQRLGNIVGVKPDQIEKFEAGSAHISAKCMADISAAMKVPVSYFFEDLDDQAVGTGGARSVIHEDEEALGLAGAAPNARSA